MPSKNDLPIYLFNEGTNYEAYRFFNVESAVYDGKKQFRFRVWAPNAHSVSVVGDFNGWDRNANVMQPLNSSGIWEGYVKNLRKFDNYKFSIENREGHIFLKADPFATHAETAPATASKFYPIEGYKWSDADFIEQRKKKDSYKSPMNIYEVHFGSWKKHEDGNYYSYRDMAETLVPYLKEAGYTHVELMPLTEHPFGGSWGYQATGLYAATSRYGTPHDFMYFVDKCHAAGISVILDFVLSHFPKDAFGLYEFDGTCLYEYNDPYKQEHKGWGTRVYDFNKPQVRSFLISAVDFWITNYHIDGLRLDAVASMLYLNYDRPNGEWRQNEIGNEYNLEAIFFLQTMNKHILSKHQGVLMIAEESTAFPMVTMPPSIGGLGFNYKWNMGFMNDILDYVKHDPFFRKDAHNKLTFSITYAFSENYVLPFSHDEVVHGKQSLIGRVPGSYEDKFKGLKALCSYQMGHPGKKLNFMGYEFGQFIEWDYKRPLDWFLLNYENHALTHKYIKALNKLYLSEKALYEQDCTYDGFRWVVVDDRTQNVVVFNRYACDGECVTVAVNFSPVRRAGYEIGVDAKGTYEELLNSEWKEFGGRAEAKPMVSTEKEMHDRKHSIALDLWGNSAIFIKVKSEK